MKRAELKLVRYNEVAVSAEQLEEISQEVQYSVVTIEPDIEPEPQTVLENGFLDPLAMEPDIRPTLDQTPTESPSETPSDEVVDPQTGRDTTSPPVVETEEIEDQPSSFVDPEDTVLEQQTEEAQLTLIDKIVARISRAQLIGFILQLVVARARAAGLL